ncbi:MAG: TetR family transcriptional regulator, partial [Pseudomonas sp.]|nr:TetR family transcriptional regulator [Pseudomonas sp.]
MSSAERREKEKQERRESILNSAEQSFFGKGYERTSMDDIAKGAQLSRALLYVYFKDKAAIMRGVMLRAGYALLNEFRAARDAGGSGLQQLERMGQSYYRFSLEQPDYFDVLTNASTFAHLMESDEQTEDMETCSALTMGCMVDSLEAGVTDGSLSRERISDPMVTAYYLR